MINNILSSIYSRSTLFNDQQKKNLVRGGVVNEQTYMSGKLRLVFLLKDPGVTRAWSWPQQMREEIKSIENRGTFSGKTGWQKTARPLGIWSYAIHNDFPTYKQVNNNTKAAKGLSYSGMTNLKKTPWKANSSNRCEVKKEARRTSKLLRQELNIMNPNIIICCGRHWVYDSITNILGFRRNNHDIRVSGERFSYSLGKLKHGKVLIVDFYHPANRHKEQASMYENLKKIFNVLGARDLLPN